MSRPSTRAAIVATSPVTRLIRARVSSDTWCSGRSLSYSSPTMPPPNVSDAAISAIVAAVTCAAPFANYLPVIPGIGSDLGKNGKFAMGLGGWEVILPVALRRFSLGRAKPPRFSPSVHANTWIPTGSAPVPGLTVPRGLRAAPPSEKRYTVSRVSCRPEALVQIRTVEPCIW